MRFFSQCLRVYCRDSDATESQGGREGALRTRKMLRTGANKEVPCLPGRGRHPSAAFPPMGLRNILAGKGRAEVRPCSPCN